VNFTHMHFRTHTKLESIGQSGRWQSPYHDAMIDHDKNVGTILKALDDQGMVDNTFVMYSTDNGPHMNSWPDAAMTPFRSEKNTNWEGAYRVPAMLRWPGHIKPGSVSNEIIAHGLAAYISGNGWRPTDKGRADEGLQGGQHDVQGPSGWRQSRAVPDGANREGPAGIVLLHQRRSATDSTAFRQLEDGVYGAAGPGNDAPLGKSVHQPARPEDVQPSHGPVRAS